MQIQTKLIVLWILCTIAMILHFNYHVGEIFYGIDVTRPNADGTVPIGVFIIRSVFYHMPFIWIFIIMYSKSSFLKTSLFVISILYAIAHLGHLIGELANPKPDISQIALLVLVLSTAIILAKEHYVYWKLNQKHS